MIQGKGGAVVLSELTGVSRSLSGALRVNPFDPNEIANALHAALTADNGSNTED